MWILEVQSYVGSGDILERGFVHVGYIDWLFKTQKDAGEFYHSLYPDYRNINRDGNWTSDWDFTNNLRYVVRPYAHECINISRCREVCEGQKEFIVQLNDTIRSERDYTDKIPLGGGKSRSYKNKRR